jgi:type IV pilus assembly protein PilP
MNRLPRAPWKLGLVALSALGLVACQQDMSDLQQFVETTKAKPPGRIEPIPQFIPYQNFEYTVQNLRDPFEKIDLLSKDQAVGEINENATGPRPDMDRVREPLESFPLDTLRFKGTITKNGEKWGLIFAPDNTIHRVQVGNYMGQNHGRVIELTDTEIKLTEIVPDGLGNYIERQAAIALIE